MFFEYVYKYEGWGRDDFFDLIQYLTTPAMHPARNILANNSEIKN